MDGQRMAFVEDFGMTFERSGAGRMEGRILAQLMISDPPQLTADDLARELQASRGSISHATRSLVAMGLIRRGRKQGSRQDLFSVLPSAWIDATHHSLRQIATYERLFRQGLALMDDASPESRATLEEAVAFMEFWEDHLPQVFDQWDVWKREHLSSAPGLPKEMDDPA
ncbi:MAG: MarR family transcriptional regulator [Thermomicrobiales bacterium]